MESNNKIYNILVFSELKSNQQGIPELSDNRLVGFYLNKETAFQAVKENWADIWEYGYDYAIIEEVNEGLYACSTTRWFFKYNINTKKYEEIPEPILFNHLCGLTMG